MESTGTATRTLILDGRVLVEDYSGSMMGTPFVGRGMRGFDTVSEEYWSTWNDSMSTGIMVSTGTCSDDHVCTYIGSWNDPIKNGPVEARMVLRWTSPTPQTLEMHAPGKDGKEMKMMELVYTRK